MDNWTITKVDVLFCLALPKDDIFMLDLDNSYIVIWIENIKINSAAQHPFDFTDVYTYMHIYGRYMYQIHFEYTYTSTNIICRWTPG